VSPFLLVDLIAARLAEHEPRLNFSLALTAGFEVKGLRLATFPTKLGILRDCVTALDTGHRGLVDQYGLAGQQQGLLTRVFCVHLSI